MMVDSDATTQTEAEAAKVTAPRAVRGILPTPRSGDVTWIDLASGDYTTATKRMLAGMNPFAYAHCVTCGMTKITYYNKPDVEDGQPPIWGVTGHCACTGQQTAEKQVEKALEQVRLTITELQHAAEDIQDIVRTAGYSGDDNLAARKARLCASYLETLKSKGAPNLYEWAAAVLKRYSDRVEAKAADDDSKKKKEKE